MEYNGREGVVEVEARGGGGEKVVGEFRERESCGSEEEHDEVSNALTWTMSWQSM